jgi:hypothetical protein
MCIRNMYSEYVLPDASHLRRGPLVCMCDCGVPLCDGFVATDRPEWSAPRTAPWIALTYIETY